MNDSIDIGVAVRDLRIRDPCYVICRLWGNDTEEEQNWNHIQTSGPIIAKRHLDFGPRFPCDYAFEKTQLIRIDICRSTEEDVPIGSCIFKVDELVGSFGLQLRRKLKSEVSIADALTNVSTASYSMGCCIITALMPEKEQPIIVQFHGKGLERKEFLWDETAVFFRVYRMEEGRDNDELVLLYESESLQNHSHPQWSEFRLSAKDVADNRNRLLEVWILYKDVDGTEGYIGKFLTTYAKMKYGPGPDNVYHVINDQKQQHKKGYENSGKVELIQFVDVAFCSFLDYIVSGTQLHFELAVDFSGVDSRGSPSEMRGEVIFDQDFLLAFRGIGGILRDYTPNRLFPAYGVGSKPSGMFNQKSGVFNLNQSEVAICRGLDGVCEAFHGARVAVAPAKSAKMAPLIQQAIKASLSSGFQGLHYHVFTIFTRGHIDDIKEITSVLPSVSEAPLTVVFVGVADADLTALQKAVRKKELARNCVQIVHLREIMDISASAAENRAFVASACLQNVPQHMVAYMHKHNIAAKPPIQVCRSPLFHSSALIPDHPTPVDDDFSPDMSPQSALRRGSDSRVLVDLEPHFRDGLTVRIPERCHSVLQTSREQYQRRLKQRGLAKMKFPRCDLATLDSFGPS